MKFRSSRRQFLQRSTLAAGTLFLTGWRDRRPSRTLSANDRLDLGVIGVSGHGRYHLNGCLRENIVALCDVDTEALAAASQAHSRATVYTDFRQMLDRERLDGVVVASADHTHAVMSIFAMQAGCHVYCADPLTRTISEARAVAAMARKRRRVTQMGGTLGAPEVEDRVVELVQSGVIGTVNEVHAWSSKTHGEFETIPTDSGLPSTIDYDLWLGPIQRRPYRPNYLPGRWRHWWHFGGGTLSDAGSGYFSLTHRALSLTAPSQIEAHGPALHLENTPSWLVARYIYPMKTPQSTTTLTWYHGGQRPPEPQLSGFPKVTDGLLFCGSQGRILVSESEATLRLNDQLSRPVTTEAQTGANQDRLCEWLEACKTQRKTRCDFDAAAGISEALHLGNVAYRTDRRLVWDPKKMVASNLPEASDYIQHNYRLGWWI